MGTRPNSLRRSWGGGVGAVTWGGGLRRGSRRQGLAGSAVPAAFIMPGLSDPPPRSRSPLLPQGLGGDGAERWQPRGWRGLYRAP